MPRTWFVCLTIVAAFPLPLFAATRTATVMAPVSEPVLAVARTLGVDPERDRVRFLPDFVRLTHSGPEDRTTALNPLRRADPQGSGVAAGPLSDQQVFVPLDAEAWSRAIFKRAVPAEQLLTAIVLDHRAALLASALLQLDDETLDWIAGVPLLLGEIYERAAPQFVALAASFHVRAGRVVPPGGESEHPLWEAAIGASLAAPESVLRLLIEAPGNGRLAYFYSVAAGLDPPHQRFLFGPPALPPAARLARFRAAAHAATSAYGEWRLDLYPFARPLNDLAMLLVRLRVDANGRPLPPAETAFWSDVWGVAAEPAADAAPAGALVDTAWLATHSSPGNIYDRGDRLDQLAFAQRVFGEEAAAARADAVTALRAFPRHRMLLLTLERMGLRAPALHAYVSRQAAHLEIGDATRGFWVMAQVQPALALVARMTMNGVLDGRRAERLVRSLFAVPIDDRQRYDGALARWLARELLPALPDATDVDTRVMLGLAGPPAGPRAPRLDWEGERYRIDFHEAELRRLQAVRDRQGGPTLAFAVEIERIASTLAAATLDAGGVVATQGSLQAALAVHMVELPSLSVTTPDVAAAGVTPPRRLRETLDRIYSDLAQAAQDGDVRRAARQAAPLHELADTLLGEALLSMAYAADLGDPDGPALLSHNGALRHDFGFGRLDGDARARILWAIPRQDFQPGIAWHVIGSALGLDVGLARLGLTRINSDRLGNAPRVTSIDRDGFAVGVALIDRRQLRDDTRDAIAAALQAGAARIAAAARQSTAGDTGALDALVERLRWPALRRRALRAVLGANPDQAAEQFTLVELLQLGDGPPLETLSAWGANGLPLTGCPCSQVISPATWPLLMGRQQLALAAAAVPDLHLKVAALLAELRVPAILARPVLAAAVQDFLEDAAPTDGGDWFSLVAAARALTRERVEDYVAAVAAVGGALMPDEEPGASAGTADPDSLARVR